MFHVPLYGGLGNQLFQVSYVLELIEAGVSVKLFYPLPFAAGAHKDRYESLISELVGEQFFQPRFFRRAKGSADLLLMEMGLRRDGSFLSRPSHRPSPQEVLEAGVGTIAGYFQHYRGALKSGLVQQLKESSFVHAPVDRDRDTARVHIRGGDYLRARALFGSLDTGYYERSLSALGVSRDETVEVITDDVTHAKKLLASIKHVHFLQDMSVQESFSTLASSSRLVTANSTFSWWAAAVALSQGARVCTPSPFHMGTISHSEFLSLPGSEPISWSIRA